MIILCSYIVLYIVVNSVTNNTHTHSLTHAHTHSHTHSQLYLGAGFNLTGSILRYLSTVEPIVCSSVFDKSGYVVAMVGQFLTACAQPFMLYAPTKLAAFWFGPNERAICTNFASVGMSVSTVCVSLPSYTWVTHSHSLILTHTHSLTHSHSLTHTHSLS